MRKTILVVAIACATTMAVAQSNARQEQSGAPGGAPQTNSQQSSAHLHEHNVVHRDLATRQDSGQNTTTQEVHTARETGSGMATGRMSGAQSNPMYKDDGKSGQNPLYESNNRAVVKSKSNITNNRVATGDVDGDGAPDSTAPAGPAQQMKGDFSRGHQPERKVPAAANAKTARETGSGMATGKRQ